MARGLQPELLERVGGADLHTLLLCLWSLLYLQLHEHPLVAPLVAALRRSGGKAEWVPLREGRQWGAHQHQLGRTPTLPDTHLPPPLPSSLGAGVRLPSHVKLLVEVALMLQLEAPPALGLSLPQELCRTAHATYLRQQQLAPPPPGPMLRGVAAALDALGLRYQLQAYLATPQAAAAASKTSADTPKRTRGHPPRLAAPHRASPRRTTPRRAAPRRQTPPAGLGADRRVRLAGEARPRRVDYPGEACAADGRSAPLVPTWSLALHSFLLAILTAYSGR